MIVGEGEDPRMESVGSEDSLNVSDGAGIGGDLDLHRRMWYDCSIIVGRAEEELPCAGVLLRPEACYDGPSRL